VGEGAEGGRTKREAAEKALAAHQEAAQALEAWLKQHAADAELGSNCRRLRVAVREWRVAHEKLAEGRKRHAEAETLKKRLPIRKLRRPF
jgi:hypothetical protein